MANSFRRFPFFYGWKPNKLGTLQYGPTLDLRKFVKLDNGENAKLIADGFWEAPSGQSGITGTLNLTLDAVTQTGAGTVALAGTGIPTLGAAVLTGAGAVALVGAASPTLGVVTLTASGSVGVSGALSLALGAVTQSGAGNIALAGALSQTLDSLALEGSGSVAGGVPTSGSNEASISRSWARGMVTRSHVRGVRSEEKIAA